MAPTVAFCEGFQGWAWGENELEVLGFLDGPWILGIHLQGLPLLVINGAFSAYLKGLYLHL